MTLVWLALGVLMVVVGAWFVAIWLMSGVTELLYAADAWLADRDKKKRDWRDVKPRKDTRP